MHLVFPYFTTFVVYAVITPYLPILIRGQGYSPTMVGILLGIFEGAGIAGPFFFGYFADKMGQYKPGLILVYVLLIAAGIPLALVHQPLISALLIAVLGMGFRSTTPLLDAVATINLGKTGNYGKIRAVGSLSFIVMVLFLQLSLFLPVDTPVNIGIWIVLSSVLALFSMIIIPGKYTGASKSGTPTPQGTALGRKTGLPLLAAGLLIIALNRLAMAPVNGFLSLYVTESLHWNAVGLVWALATLAELPFMFISNRFIRRFGALPLLAVTTAAVGIRLGIYVLFPTKGGIIVAQLLHSFCYGIFHPAAVAFIASCVPPERRALGMSLYLSLGTGLPTLVGNILGGIIVEHLGYRALFGSFISFAVLALILYCFIHLKIRRSVAGNS
ncbi:transporter, major facilitator family [Treponema primitia ZAS-2]|uniref:Transporter, major facilitator family n=1 Tax=Treponema primitia (strain ATCC BAA-887 / DSM 12427 / ZAS-2) TaxID=545694 RepID=F5YPD3_TREPZ|nr:MFS transporter [Treponema primitia]AEF84510.1 transporter, major facilitator family [Treponema primitia ZAS-2]